MKKLYLIMLLTVLASTGYTQETEPLRVYKYVDEMENRIHIKANYSFVAEKEGSAHIVIDPMLKHYTFTKVTSITGFIVISNALRPCHEKDYAILLFANGEKVKLVSYYKFSCKEYTYFNIKDDVLKLLKTEKLIKLRVRNGFSNKSVTLKVSEEMQSYFIRIFDYLNTHDLIERPLND